MATKVVKYFDIGVEPPDFFNHFCLPNWDPGLSLIGVTKERLSLLLDAFGCSKRGTHAAWCVLCSGAEQPLAAGVCIGTSMWNLRAHACHPTLKLSWFFRFPAQFRSYEMRRCLVWVYVSLRWVVLSGHTARRHQFCWCCCWYCRMIVSFKVTCGRLSE